MSKWTPSFQTSGLRAGQECVSFVLSYQVRGDLFQQLQGSNAPFMLDMQLYVMIPTYIVCRDIKLG